MGQYFFHPTHINITYCILLVTLFAMEFNKDLLFEQSNFHSRRSRIDNEFDVTRQNRRIEKIENRWKRRATTLNGGLMRTSWRISTLKKLLAYFLLVAVLSQTLLSFVCGHLMALSFFTARHSNIVYGVELLILLIKTSIWLFTDSSRTSPLYCSRLLMAASLLPKLKWASPKPR